MRGKWAGYGKGFTLEGGKLLDSGVGRGEVPPGGAGLESLAGGDVGEGVDGVRGGKPGSG